MTRRLYAFLVVLLGSAVSPWTAAQNANPTLPACTVHACWSSQQTMQQYEQEHDCSFTLTPGLQPNQNCQTAADLFYEAIKKQETSGSKETPSPSNNFLPARNGEPASPGHPVPNTPYYSASYGTTQMTLGTLMPAVQKLIKQNTDCAHTPTCLAPCIKNSQYKPAIQQWDTIAKAVQDAVSRGNCGAKQPQAAPGTKRPFFPPRPTDSPISQSMWDRISAWNVVANSIATTHDEIPGDSGYAIAKTLYDDSNFRQMLIYLGMGFEFTESYPEPTEENPKPVYRAPEDTVNNYINYGKPFYNKRPRQFPEAVSSFQTGAFFTQSALNGNGHQFFNDLLSSVFGEQCNKYFSMALFKALSGAFGSGGTLAQQDAWVRTVAGRWNGSGTKGTYAASVEKIYNDLVTTYLKDNNLKSLPETCPGDAPATLNACAK
ncbi:MAG: hypothetical protein LWW92_14285 [Rhodocyclales bacterium]|nr:hypothetical protein [Rhodocyclales bacterium]